jgi:transposase
MKNFRSYDRSQRLLLPPDLRDWVADDDLAHFIVEAVERVDISSFHVSRTGSGKAQYHPRMMLGLLIYSYASGIFSSRRIEQATYRHVSVRFITADTHPDHDTVATFRRQNAKAFSSAFEQVLLLASEAGLLKVGTVSVDGTKIDANASKIKSIRYDRLKTLQAKLAADIADLTARAEAADAAAEDDGLSLPEEIARRASLKKKLDEAAVRLERMAAQDHEGDDEPPAPAPEKQTNLTDADSAIMRKSARHEYRQAYNAQAAVDADGSMLVLATDVLSTTNDRAGLDTLLDRMEAGSGLPETLVADAGYAGEDVLNSIETRGIEALIAVTRGQAERPYDFRPPPERKKPPKAVTAQWRLDMIDKLQSSPTREQYKKRKQSVEPVFGIIKSAIGFTRFHLRGIENVKSEWTLMTLAWNCKRIARMAAA